MKVVIVAKTRMGSGACVGGLTLQGRSLRLIAADQETNDRFNQEYEIGAVWDVSYTLPGEIIPPHQENIIVHSKRELAPLPDIVPFVERWMPPKIGGLEMVFDGLTQATESGALYIAQASGVPAYSTFFWRPDQALLRDDVGKRIRYRYPTADGGRTLTFVGYQEPLCEIPAGTLLRVSLAHWWRPQERPDIEMRCFVQLSGWFLPADPDSRRRGAIPSTAKPPGAPGHPAPDSLLLSTPGSDGADPASLLRHVFGYEEFRPMQQEIIANILEGQDVLAVMPTGSGKSLCYQLPALLLPGLTVVVSPLISLMDDQVMQLRELGVAAVALNSTLGYGEYLRAVRQLRERRAKLLYTSPETLLRPETLVLLDQLRVDCLAIDEAHCISEWGHDFRPEYRQLVTVRHRLPGAACLAVTATATKRVRADIRACLELDGDREFIASFNRENLFLEVAPKTDMVAQTLAFLNGHQGESGIIYCATRRQAENLSDALQQHGWEARPYHAGLDTADRQRYQRQFRREDIPIIVATVAFGMGINKSNVRFILHVDLPKNLESYYQQIGRAGRDGLPAHCLLLYRYGDTRTINHFIRQQEPSLQAAAQMRLEAMLGFAKTNRCRRKPLLAYFDDPYEVDTCAMCDNCVAEPQELVDVTVPAQKFLSCVIRTHQKFGANHIIDVLRGSRRQKVIAISHDRLSTYNIGREFSRRQWQQLARQFIQQELLLRNQETGSLRVTEKGWEVLRGETFWGTLMERRLRERGPVPVYNAGLFELLRARRKALADVADVPPYVIFSDRTLVEMATYFPHSRRAFSTLYGVGNLKMEKYAEEFLPLIRAYCVEHNLAETHKASKATPPRGGSNNRRRQAIQLWNEGWTLTDIAAHCHVTQRTVLGYLWRAVQEGEVLRPGNFCHETGLALDENERALRAFAQYGTDFLRPVFEALEETIPYHVLHLLRLHFVLNAGHLEEA